MATTKDQTTTTAKGQPAAKKAETKTEAAPYADQAAALADDTRALIESMRKDVGDLSDRLTKLNETEPGADDGPTADAVRRIPMAVNEVIRALSVLDHTAAELARTATG